jgi:2-polyprenyl-6-methoxyphenol hydroxylase-like FAD-dependent oxidoreductase
MPMSTHYLQPPGMRVLDQLGVGDGVRAVTPPSADLRLAFDGDEAIVPMIEGHPGYCVRRSTIDPLLQDAAEAAGAEFRDRHRVVDLVRDGDRVAGVVAETTTGRETFLADWVVGADGPSSTVARLVGAEEYLTAQSTRGGYWLYFPAPERWTEKWDATLEHRGEEIRYVFRADGDLVILAAVGAEAEITTWGKDWRERTIDMLEASPTTAALLGNREPVGKGCGLIRTRYFYRKPIGNGFALVGDAGHFKDFVTGQGMADALEDAERLSTALLDGREVAMEVFWRERDVATLPLHFDALRQGRVGHNEPFMRWVIGRLGKRPDLLRRAALVQIREMSPYDMIPMSTMLGFVGAALLRGRLDVVKGFLAAGKELGAEKKELALRRALLEAARKRLADDKRTAGSGSFQRAA